MRLWRIGRTQRAIRKAFLRFHSPLSLCSFLWGIRAAKRPTAPLFLNATASSFASARRARSGGPIRSSIFSAEERVVSRFHNHCALSCVSARSASGGEGGGVAHSAVTIVSLLWSSNISVKRNPHWLIGTFSSHLSIT